MKVTNNKMSLLLLVGGLSALYVYQRRGGSISQLFSRAFDFLRSGRQALGRIGTNRSADTSSVGATAGASSTLQ